MKKLLYLFALLSISIFVSFFASAEQGTNSGDSLKESINARLFSTMNDEVKNSLESIGIDEIDFEKIYSVSAADVISLFTPEVLNRGKNIFRSFMRLFVLIMILSVFSVVLKDSSTKNTLFILGTAIAILISVKSISDGMNSCLSVLKLSGGFMTAFVPVLTLIISFSGNFNSALAYNAVALMASEIISVILNNSFINLVGCFLCLGISFSLSGIFDVDKLVNVTNKIVNFFFGIAGGLFSGLLSVKGLMAASVDGVSQKGIRILISSLIPVVGSTISDAYSSLIGSINLIKSSVAVIGILAVSVINLPVFVEILMYRISFSVLSFVSDLCSCSTLSKYFNVVACVTRLLLIAMIFEMFILMISTGIMLSLKGAV